MKDLFVKVPEFLAAFNRILKEGFFEDIDFHVHGLMMEGRIHACSIIARGCVPNNKKCAAKGCGAIVNPDQIIATCRELAKRHKIQSVQAQVKTDGWPLYDRSENQIVGTKGTRTELSLYILFKT